ncbi:hypothetical protein SAMN02799616_01730 [Paenibacillus sp. UNC499MF]|nr:hypothetical protein SAMN02799616_01730 [Paenibacillus sp. UNC499MF]
MHNRKNKRWYFFSLSALFLLVLSLFVFKNFYPEPYLLYMYGNFILPIILTGLAFGSLMLNEKDELLTLAFLFAAAFFYYFFEFEKLLLVKYLLTIILPIIFIIRLFQYFKRKKLF